MSTVVLVAYGGGGETLYSPAYCVLYSSFRRKAYANIFLFGDPLIIQSRSYDLNIYLHVPRPTTCRFLTPCRPVGVDGNIHTNWLAKA